jgi:hypothetical protein
MGQLTSRPRGRSSIAAITALALVAPLVALAPAAIAAPSQFGAYPLITLAASPEAVAIGDVTGDGLADVVLTTGYTNSAEDFHLYVLAGQADGTLAAPTSYATAGTYPNRPETVDVGDVNGDGRVDVVVGLSGLGVQVFAQAADGTLAAPTFVASADSHRVAIGAFDGTGRAQVAGVGWGTNTVTVFSDTGSGLGATATYAARHGGYEDLEAADVTGDGRTDIVVMSGQSWVPNVSVIAQQAGGGFAAAAEYGVGGNLLTQGIGVGDVTGDGRLDVVASWGGNSPNGRIGVFAQTGGGTLVAPPTAYQSYDIPAAIDVADVDKDGRLDVVVSHDGWARIGVYPGLAGGTLGAEQLYPIPSSNGGNPQGLAVGDVTNDGWADIVYADDLHGLVILANAGTTAPPPTPTPSPTVTYPPPTPTPSPTAKPTPPPTPSPTPTPVAPSVPRSLAASPNLPPGVGLSWQPPATPGSAPVTGYRIYRGTGTAALAALVTVGDVLSYTDAGVSLGTTYRYAVSAISAAGEGTRSAEVSAPRGSAPSAPRSLTATTTKSGVALTWASPATDGGTAVTGYRVYRGTTSGTQSFYVAYGANAIGMTDTAVARRTTYWYRVTAVNALGEGVSSATVSATSK